MIATSYIDGNLRSLNKAYLGAKTQRFSYFYAKLAILELCGWIEVSMDDIVISHSKRILKSPGNISYVSDTVVDRTFGFEYERHFREMLVRVLGIGVCEKVEASINVTVQTKFVTELGQLKKLRNRLAHTYIKGTTTQIDAPSVTLQRYADIRAGLKAYEGLIRAL